MEQCNKNIDMLPLPNRRFPYTEQGIISAQENGFKEGWKAALEWILYAGVIQNDFAGKLIKEELGIKDE